jgi:hypothetical protein
VWTSVLGGVAMWWNDGGPLGITETKRRGGSFFFAIAGTGDFDGDGTADLRWASDQGSIALELFSTIRNSTPRILDLPEAHFSAARLLN